MSSRSRLNPLESLFEIEKCKSWVFSALTERKLESNHSIKLPASRKVVSSKLSMLRLEMESEVSSENSVGLAVDMQDGRVLMKSRNRVGPKTEP